MSQRVARIRLSTRKAAEASESATAAAVSGARDEYDSQGSNNEDDDDDDSEHTPGPSTRRSPSKRTMSVVISSPARAGRARRAVRDRSAVEELNEEDFEDPKDDEDAVVEEDEDEEEDDGEEGEPEEEDEAAPSNKKQRTGRKSAANTSAAGTPTASTANEPPPRFTLISEFGQTTLVNAEHAARVKGTAASFSMASADAARGGRGRGRGSRRGRGRGGALRGGRPVSASDSPAPGRGGRGGAARGKGRGGYFGAGDRDDDEEEDEDGDQDGGDDDDEEGGGNDEEGGDAANPAELGDEEVPADIASTVWVQGKETILFGDELVLEEDPDGDQKIDKHGNLLGGREWRCRYFTCPTRPDPKRIYMLSIEAARMVGYRDSLYFFRRNPRLVRLFLVPSEKENLIELGFLDAKFKGRNVAVIAARNVYKLFGHKCIKGGRAVQDDYYEAAARDRQQNGGPPTLGSYDDIPRNAALGGGRRMRDRNRDRASEREREKKRKEREPYEHTQFNALTGRPEYTLFGDTGLNPIARAEDKQKQKQILAAAQVDEVNWMHMMARSVHAMNDELAQYRRERLVPFPPPGALDHVLEEKQREAHAAAQDASAPTDEMDVDEAPPVDIPRPLSPPIGLYEPATNTPHYASSTQPTSATFERISSRAEWPGAPSGSGPILGGSKVGSRAWGLSSFATYVEPAAPWPESVRVKPPLPAPRQLASAFDAPTPAEGQGEDEEEDE